MYTGKQPQKGAVSILTLNISGKQFLMILLFLLSLGCISSPSAQHSEQEGTVYLTVSEITFDVAGEKENIYIGTALVESIQWYSEDESVVTVDNGILTAVGAGKTVIHAELGEQHWQCIARCLASNSKEYQRVSDERKKEPKRLPPVTDYDYVPFFQEAGICGDSISWMFGQSELRNNTLGHPQFLARGGCGINGFVLHYKELFYKGAERPLGEVVAESGVKYLFIMLGQNDLGYLSVEETLALYGKLLDMIREKAPDVQIFLETCTPQTAHSEGNPGKNVKIREFNARLVSFAEEYDCELVDVAIYAEDHLGNLPESYHADSGIHLNDEGCRVWAQVLSNYAQLYEIRMEEAK